MITLRLDSQAYLAPLSGLPGLVVARIKDKLTFDNPAHQDAQARGFSAWNIPGEICGWRIEADRLIIPRGFTRQLVEILQRAGIQYRIDDRRRTLTEVNFTFRGELRDFQEVAVDAMASRNFGTLTALAGSGKKIMALALVALRRQPALVVVHTRELMEQWVSRIEEFLGIPAGEVGIIGNGKQIIGDKITVGLVQSLYDVAHEVATFIGHLVIAECHETPSRTFTEVVTAFDSRYMLGLGATSGRQDGLEQIVCWSLGDLAHHIDKWNLLEAGHIKKEEYDAQHSGAVTLIDRPGVGHERE